MIAVAPLPVDFAPASEHLATADGRPVWPVTPGDRARFERFCASLSIPTEPTKGHVVSSAAAGQSALRRGTVIGIGNNAESAARLYAHLTGRFAAGITSTNSDAEWNSAAVVVTTPEHLTPALLEVLYGKVGRSFAPGLICAPRHHLRTHVLHRSAAVLAGTRPLPMKTVELLPTLPFSLIATDSGILAGGSATPDELVHALRTGSELLAITTHSDGIDADLGELILCGAKGQKFDESTERPCCVDSGVCHRIGVDLNVAVTSLRLTPVSIIRARILLFNTCHGLSAHPSLINLSWTLGFQIAHFADVGAFLTSWGQFATSAIAHRTLVQNIADGNTLGEAVATHNARHDVQMRGQYLALCGDPEVRVNSSGTISERPLSSTLAQSRTHTTNRAALKGLDVMRSYLLGVQDAAGKSAVTTTSLQMIANYELYLRRGLAVEANLPHVARMMRTRFLRVLSTHGSRPSKYWQQFASSTFASRGASRPCIACGGRTLELVNRLRSGSAISRKLQSCFTCGEVADMPAAMEPPTLSVSGKEVTISELPKGAAWDAILLIDPKNPHARAQKRWPKHSTRVALPQSSTRGLVYVAFIAVVETDFFMVRAPMRLGA
jgi:hypothetical protein